MTYFTKKTIYSLIWALAMMCAAPTISHASEEPYQLAQSGDSGFRVNALEEEVRRLNGKVEELTFQLLQLQEQLRKMQEDNELRFQELEDQSSNGSATPKEQVTKAPAQTNTGDNRLGKSESSARPSGPDVKETAKIDNPAPPKNESGAPPRALGTLKFDKDGNVIDTQSDTPKKPLDQFPDIFNDGVEGSIEASEFGATPAEVFEVAAKAYESRNYSRAEQAYRAFVKAWPKDKRVGVARYYLGQSLFWQKDYYNAANVYLETHNAFPESKTAPDNLLGLGLALAGMNQREVACATYAEVLKQYPSAKARLGERVKDEQTSTRC